MNSNPMSEQMKTLLRILEVIVICGSLAFALVKGVQTKTLSNHISHIDKNTADVIQLRLDYVELKSDMRNISESLKRIENHLEAINGRIFSGRQGE